MTTFCEATGEEIIEGYLFECDATAYKNLSDVIAELKTIPELQHVPESQIYDEAYEQGIVFWTTFDDSEED